MVSLHDIAELLLEREGNGGLVPFLKWFTGYSDRQSDRLIASSQIHLGLLLYWLREAPGCWPPSETQAETIVKGTSQYLHISPDEISLQGWKRALSEIVEGILPRHLAVMEERLFQQHRAWIERVSPHAVTYRDGLAQPVSMDKVRAALAYEKDRDHTVFFLGASPSEEGLIRDALRATGRTGSVHLVNKDQRVIRALQEHFHASGGSMPLFDQADYTDPAYLDGFTGAADRVFLIYPNRLTSLASGLKLLREGGRLVFQHIIGEGSSHPHSEKVFREAMAGVQTVLAFKNTRPIIRTAQSEAFPAGNVFLVADKKRIS